MAVDPRHPLAKALEAIAERVKGDTPAIRKLQAEVNRLASSAGQLDTVHRNRSPLDTEAAHALKVAKLARQYGSRVTEALNRGLGEWAVSRAELEQRIVEKINLKPDPKFAAEIRSVFRTVDGTKRLEMLGQFVKENRGPELAAILEGPAFLTGISEEQKSAYRASMISTHAAAEQEELEALDEAAEGFQIANRTASNFAKELTDPGRLAKIERDANAAAEADLAFKQSLGLNDGPGA